MPGSWKAIHVERLWMRGGEWSMTARAGAAGVVLEPR
jgi:hypothetical protein